MLTPSEILAPMGHRYITERLRALCVADVDPSLRAILNEAATVIVGRDAALDNVTAFKLLRHLVDHWDEFGPEHGLDEKMDEARGFVRRALA